MDNARTRVLESTVSITKTEHDRGLFVGLLGDDHSTYLGDVFFPAGTLESGWKVTIRASEKNPRNNHHNDNCGEDGETKSKTRASPVFDISVTNRDGDEIKLKNVTPPIEFTAFAPISLQDQGCYGYSETEDDTYHCLSSFKLQQVGTKEVGTSLVQSESTHLTSFAVLLEVSGSMPGSCNWLWWILTLGFLCGAIAFSVVFAAVGRNIQQKELKARQKSLLDKIATVKTL